RLAGEDRLGLGHGGIDAGLRRRGGAELAPVVPDPGGRRAGRPRRPPAREPALKGPHPGLVDLVGRLIGARGGDGRVPVIAVVGAQGSGKTTLARAAAARFGAAQISIDDVYLTRAEREALARDVHPLLLTRGPP